MGILKFANGDYYKGCFSKDNFTKEGTYFYNKGDKWEGTWKDGLKHGSGKFTGKNGGRVIIGNWVNDKLEEF